MSTQNGYTAEQRVARDVLTTAVEGGISYWSRIHTYRWDCPPQEVVVEGVDTEDENSLFRVTLEDVTEAIVRIAEHPLDCGLGVTAEAYSDRLPTLLRAIRSQQHYGVAAEDIDELGEIDATYADIIVQVAVVGELIYG